MEVYEQLDKVLNFINSSTIRKSFHLEGDEIPGGITWDEIYNLYWDTSNEIVDTLSIILEELVNSGYVIHESWEQEGHWDSNYPDIKPQKITVNFYSITFKGKILLAKGGYTNVNANVQKNEKTIIRLQKGLTWATVVLAVGTIGLLLIEIYRTFHHQ